MTCLEMTPTHLVTRAQPAPFRFVFKERANVLGMLQAQRQSDEQFNRAGIRKDQLDFARVERRIEWHAHTPVIGEPVEADDSDVLALIKAGLLTLPAGCMAIAVQEYVGCKDTPYTTQGHYYVSDQPAFVPREEAVLLMERQICQEFDRQVQRAQLYRLCHGQQYVTLLNGIVMVSHSWGLISFQDAFRTKQACQTLATALSATVAEPEQSDIATQAVPPRAPRRVLTLGGTAGACA